VSQCDREASTMRDPDPLGAVAPWGKNVILATDGIIKYNT